MPSLSQTSINCDACKGKHSKTNAKCSGVRRQKRSGFVKNRILDLKTMKVLPFKGRLTDECIGPRKKIGTAILKVG